MKSPIILPMRAMLVVLLAGLILAGLPGCKPRKPAAPVEVRVPVESTRVVALAKTESALTGLKRLKVPDARYLVIMAELPKFGVGSERAGPGESLVGFFRDENLYRFEYRKRYDQTYILSFDSGGIRLACAYHWVRVEPRVSSGTIRNSLWGSMIRIGQSPGMIMRFADLFSWDVDFFTETHAGDSFKLLTEQLWCDDRPIGTARLIVGQYKGKVGNYHGFFFEDPSGRKDYYTEKGEAVRKGFLKSPLQFSKVSSGFGGRYHPILRYLRPHNGVDYAARTGTPVSAVGDGTVIGRGWAGGYGNLVKIRHAGGYESRYGHLSRFGKIRQGQRVSQGTIIGYVGTTGMSTGPHLHFEIRVNGVPRNPLKIIPPRAPPVARQYLPAFKARADSLVKLLRASTMTVEDKTAPVDSAIPTDSVALDTTKNL